MKSFILKVYALITVALLATGNPQKSFIGKHAADRVVTFSL